MQKKIYFWVMMGIGICSVILSSPKASLAVSETVQEEEPKYKTVSKPLPPLYEPLYKEQTAYKKRFTINMIAGLAQGVDSNVNLDSLKKVDSYTEENLDVHFKYPFSDRTRSRFGFIATNVTYYDVTDASLFDGIADISLEHDIFDSITIGTGYAFEGLIYPNDESGTFVGNEINASIKQTITKRIYQKGTYKLLFKNFIYRHYRLGDAQLSSTLREDVRNTFQHELGVYIGDSTKVKVINQFYINDSNDQFFDFYDYRAYKVGGSIIHFFTKKLYTITGFYYQRKNYDSRRVTNADATQRDNLYLFSSTVLYDITKAISIFINYSYRENHTNEPLEKYSGSIYSAGVYYSF